MGESAHTKHNGAFRREIIVTPPSQQSAAGAFRHGIQSSRVITGILRASPTFRCIIEASYKLLQQQQQQHSIVPRRPVTLGRIRWGEEQPIMPPNFASSLIISATGFIGRTFLRYGTKELKVEGLPILTNALREGNMEVVPSSRDKGKGRAVQSSAVDASGNTALAPVKRRRGIVTSEQLFSGADRALRTVCNHNSVMDDPFVRCRPSGKTAPSDTRPGACCRRPRNGPERVSRRPLGTRDGLSAVCPHEP